MEHKKISAKGGRMTKKKYGVEHFSMIGKRGGKAKLRMYGIDYFKKLSALGVAARKAKAESKKTIVQRIVDTIVTN